MNTIIFTKMFPDVLPPRQGTPNSVGADVHAYIKTESGRPSKMMIPVQATRAIPTGIVVKHFWSSQPEPYSIFVCSRSGMAKKSVFVTNSPGVIDPDYRGEVIVLLYNGSHEPQWIEDGDRIAQLVLMPIPIPVIAESNYDLRNESTARGGNGFGSTGR